MGVQRSPVSIGASAPAVTAAALAAAALAFASGCSTSSRSVSADREDGLSGPVIAQPGLPRDLIRPPVQLAEIDLTEPGAVVRTTIEPIIVDTRDFPVQIQDVRGAERTIREILPPHQRPRGAAPGEPNNLVAGGLMEEPVARGLTTFTGLDRTGWNPPDPAIAVGPNHVVQVVNQSLAFYTKTGTLQFSAILGNQGNPGFFEDIGAESFAFDPKCFYDHYENRFVVLALEVYGSNNPSTADDEAYVTIAISDDDDPNGVWYKYRTDVVTNIGGINYWWDYPGLGYDDDAWYVTSNLFAFDSGPFGNVGYRIFDKTNMLSGLPAQFSTLRDPNAASVQIGQHFGNNQAPFFVSVQNSTSLRINAITNPLTNPQIQTTSVATPQIDQPTEAPVAAGGSVSNVDLRIMNVHWRDGQLYAAHTVGGANGNRARWYHMDTQNWPSSGDVSLVQSGEIDPGPGVFTFFPAIYADANQNVGMVFGQSSSSESITMRVTGRTPTSPLGEMGDPIVIRDSTQSGSAGRWGDYYDIAIDPSDGLTFWAVGQTDESGIGWDTWINAFSIGDVGFGLSLALETAVPDIVQPNSSFDIEFTVDLGTDTQVGTPELIVGPQGSSTQTIAATLIGPNRYRATVPGFGCDSTIEAQISAQGQVAGNVTLPPNGGTYSIDVGERAVVFSDNAETDPGYTVSGNAGDGQWSRGVPVGGGDRADPANDADGSGSAWLTDNVDGNSDVDDGRTILTSPVIDFTGGGEIRFSGWLNDVGGGGLSPEDGLFLEITNNGTNWNRVVSLNSAASIWRDFEVDVTAQDAGPNFQIRFIAADEGAQGVVEAGVDAISFSRLSCEDCVADFNSDDTVNVFDIIDFLANWDAEGPGADFNDDGDINVFDIIDFLGVWNEGCP